MEALERYYNEYLMNYSDDSNCWGYDTDMQYTRDRVEEILSSDGLTADDIDFIRELIPEIENDDIRHGVEEYIESVTV